MGMEECYTTRASSAMGSFADGLLSGSTIIFTGDREILHSPEHCAGLTLLHVTSGFSRMQSALTVLFEDDRMRATGVKEHPGNTGHADRGKRVAMTDIRQINDWRIPASAAYERLLGTIGTEEFGSTVRDCIHDQTAGARRVFLFEATVRCNTVR